MKRTGFAVYGIIVLIGAAAAPAAHASSVTTYGAGLKACRAYLEARDRNTDDQVAFIDWLSGYVSAVNKTSHHRNNFLGLSDLGGVMSRIDAHCEARPQAQFAEAVWTSVFGTKTGPAAHAVKVTNYGSVDRSCRAYHEAKEQQNAIAWEEFAAFTNWLGGYLSGVNAISLSTDDVLGNAELPEALSWLDTYCAAHPVTAFGAAVDALVAANERDRSKDRIR
jgi:hypothetical protein